MQEPILRFLKTIPTISLEDVNRTASFQKRFDRKYLIPADRIVSLLNSSRTNLLLLQIDGRQSSHYRSSYLDSAEYALYRDAAHKRRLRYKLRIREYRESDQSFIEMKSNGLRGANSKSRMPFSGDIARDISSLTNMDELDAQSYSISALTEYERITLVASDRSMRITIDFDLGAGGPGGIEDIQRDWVIVEVKSAEKSNLFERELWLFGFRPMKFSKYAFALHVAHPDLPSNKWSKAFSILESSHA